MRVGEIMSHEVKTVTLGAPARAARDEMLLHHVHHLVVVAGKKVVGVVSDHDLGGRRGSAPAGPVEDHMAPDPVVVDEHATTRQAANLMRGRSIGCLPVLNEGRLVGIVTVTDLLELIGNSARRASTDARWKPVKRMGRRPRPEVRHARS